MWNKSITSSHLVFCFFQKIYGCFNAKFGNFWESIFVAFKTEKGLPFRPAFVGWPICLQAQQSDTLTRLHLTQLYFYSTT
jgi:hypothetical protein